MTHSSVTVLITDGEHRAALAATRSLARSGFRVVVASHLAHSLAGASRFASDSLPVPDPMRDRSGFQDAIRTAVGRLGIRVVLPVTDQSIAPLLAVRDTLFDAVIPLPSLETWNRIGDKKLVLEAAARLGLAIPEQCALYAPPRGEYRPPFPFPVVVKPARSLVTGPAGPRKTGVMHAADSRGLAAILRGLSDDAWPVLIQQRISGPGMGVFLMMDQGRPAAVFAHRRILEKPPWGGVSVCSESVALDPSLLGQSVDLLRRFDWEGVAMVEYKLDTASGVPCLMEVNGRLWGSLQLSVDAGVDFPTLLVRRALHERVAPVTSWRLGLRCRWRLGELDHLIARLRAGKGMPPSSTLSQALRHAFIPAWGSHEQGEVLRAGDPRPAWVEFRNWIRGH